MAHPLNTPVYDTKKKRETEGYSILQPRVSNSLPADDSSIYARLHGNDPGTDPYTKATSDVYQDLFQEGSFIGKGIYDIDAFELALKDIGLPEEGPADVARMVCDSPYYNPREYNYDELEGLLQRAYKGLPPA